MCMDNTCTDCMSSKTISLSDDAYHALVQTRRPGESFSDVVRRLTRRRSLTELTGVMPPEGAEAVANAILANREARAKARRAELGL